MVDHGVKPEKLYATMPDEPDKVYPHRMMIPASAFEGEAYEPGQKCTIKIEIEIDSMTKEYYDCKLIKSEEVEDDNDADDKE